MAKGTTVEQALGVLASEGYTGLASVYRDKYGRIVARRIPKAIHQTLTPKLKWINKIFGRCAKAVTEYKRMVWKQLKGEELARFDLREFIRFKFANILTACCGYSYPRFKVNSYEPPPQPKIVRADFDDKNKLHIIVKANGWQKYYPQGAVRLTTQLHYAGVKSGEHLAQIVKFERISETSFEVYFVIDQIYTHYGYWGTTAVKFSQLDGGVLHLYADMVGVPDDETLGKKSSRSPEYKFELPARELDKVGKKIRAKCKDVSDKMTRKKKKRKGIEKAREEYSEYYKGYYQRNKVRIAEKNRRWNKENSEYVSTYKKRYYRKNRKKILSKAKAHYYKNKKSAK